MKRNLLRCLTLGGALLLSLVSVAQSYTITPMWTTRTDAVTDGAGVKLAGHRMRQPAMDVDGSLYILGGNYTNCNTGSELELVKGVLFIPGDGSAARLISSGMYSVGFASCFDETGTDGTKGSVYVYHAVNHTYVNNASSGAYAESYDRAPTTLTIKRPFLGTGANGGDLNGLFGDNSRSKYFNLTGNYSVDFPIEYIEVTGGVHSGGHIWFVPSTTTTDELEITAISVASFALNGKLVIKTGLKNLNASGTETSENRIDFYDTSNASAYRALLELQNNGHYDVTINMNTGKMTSCVRIPDANSNYLSTGAKIFIFDGHKFMARGTRSGNSSYSTEFEILNIDNIEKPVVVATISPTYGSPAVQNSSVHIGTYINALKVNNNRVDIIAYSPGLGATRYAMMTSAGTMDVSATLQRDATKSQDQNVILKWKAVSGATSYKVEWQRCYISEDGTTVKYRTSGGSSDTDETKWYVLTESTTSTTASHNDVVCTYSSNTNLYYRSFNRYRITASNGIVMYAQANLELLPANLSWETKEIQNYNGYQKVQLFWKNMSATNGGSLPCYYDVYRDGVKINPQPVQVYNYIDNAIPAGEHTYTVVGKFLGANGDIITNKLESTVTVEPRDWTKTTYSLEEIYNYPIGKNSGEVWATGTSSTEFDNLLHNNGVRYKQGVYYKGNWYVAQQCDANATSTEAYGGVIRFSADKSGILNKANNKRIIRYENMSATWSATGGQGGTGFSAGLAMDEGGNIFVRRYGKTSTGAQGHASFVFELGYGHIYMRNADGTYNTANPILVDLHDMQIHDTYGHNDSYLYYGRVDYYCMSGDLSKIGGTAYLYVSSHLSKRSNRILLKRTGDNTITATLDRKIDVVLTNTETGEEFKTGDENYVFPVKYLKHDATTNTYSEAYRNAYIHNLRGNGYFYMDPGVRQKAIFETRSRINNAGGCTIGFNDEIFLITPQNVYSKNTGHFIVNMANRVATDANGNETALTIDQADLTEPIPVAQFTQNDMSSSVYTDVNGNWLYAVHGTIDGEKDVYGTLTRSNHDCVYIYQYVPGYRFAKYRLIPNNYFPPAPINITINTRYDKNSAGTENVDILGFDGVVTWEAPDLNSTSGGNKSYDYVSYTYVLTDVGGNVVDKRVITRAEAEAMNYTINYPWEGTTTYNGNPVVLTPNDDESPKNYIAYITVNYENLTDSSDKHKSEQTVDEDRAGYEGVGATGTVTVVPSAPINAGKDGSGNQYLQELDRVDINIDAPDFNKAGKEEEPVSHYEIWVDKDGDGVYEYQLPGFNLMNGGEGQYIEVNDGKIPGDYDFSNEDYAIAGGKDEATNQATNGATVVASPTTLFFNVTGEPYIKGTTPPEKGENEDPAKWKYQVVTVYASTTQGDTNRDISQTYSNGMSTSKTDVMTGIDGVMAGGELKVYPVPVKSQLTIESPESLETVKIYSISGVMVQSFVFNGEEIATIDVDSLAPGYYFVIVNNLTPVKIIKQ